MRSSHSPSGVGQRSRARQRFLSQRGQHRLPRPLRPAREPSSQVVGDFAVGQWLGADDSGRSEHVGSAHRPRVLGDAAGQDHPLSRGRGVERGDHSWTPLLGELVKAIEHGQDPTLFHQSERRVPAEARQGRVALVELLGEPVLHPGLSVGVPTTIDSSTGTGSPGRRSASSCNTSCGTSPPAPASGYCTR